MKHNSISLAVAALFLLSAVSLTSSSENNGSFTPIYNPTLEVARTTGAIKIDGHLDDPGWQGASVADNFVEHEPGDQIKPPVETKALITYDDQNLYVAFLCYDDPAAVRATYCDRDQLRGNDVVELLIDTYGDAAWAYELMTNPYGIQCDWLWSRSGGWDIGYDMIWESEGKITDFGYQVEIAVPFSSLRFPNQEEQIWKVDFYRIHPRRSWREYSWAAYDRNEPCWPCQWGTITGIRNTEPGKGVEIIPSLMSYQSGALYGSGTLDSPFEFANDDLEGELSLNTKYEPTSNIGVEATLNPDFSQVEADADQIDVNTTFALFYPERRPFFQEGSDLFKTWIITFYTRTINNPRLAAKMTGRMNKTSFAYVLARDEDSPMVLPFEESSGFLSTGQSSSNVLRMKRTFGTDSHAGILVTDRRLDGGGSGTLLSFDSQIYLYKNFRLQGQVIGSYTMEPKDEKLTGDIEELIEDDLIDSTFDGGSRTAALDGESYAGHGLMINLEERSRHLDFDATYWEFSPTYRADLGYRPSNNWRQTELTTTYTFYYENGTVERIKPNAYIGKRWNFNGTSKIEVGKGEIAVQLKGQMNISTSYERKAEKLKGIRFHNIWNANLYASKNFSEMFSLRASLDFGHQIARLENPPVMGKQREIDLYSYIRPTRRLLVEPSFTFAASSALDSDENLFEGSIFRTRLYYQITKELSLRWVVQYNGFYETWNVDPLLTYRLSPFSVFYFGTTYDYCKFDGLGIDGAECSTHLTSRQFFMKLQYLFQM